MDSRDKRTVGSLDRVVKTRVAKFFEIGSKEVKRVSLYNYSFCELRYFCTTWAQVAPSILILLRRSNAEFTRAFT